MAEDVDANEREGDMTDEKASQAAASDGERAPEMADANPDVTVLFYADRCIHNRYCVLTRPDVFVPNVVGPWIHPERASVEEIHRLALGCPSGAIQYRMKNGTADERPPMVNAATVRENGPYAVHAETTVVGHGDHLRATLCRCGQSKNKPFCDNSHIAAGFQASGEPPARKDEPLVRRDGPLTIQPTEDGPYLVKGSLEIIAGTGHTVARVTKTALCRCGHSQNKPFCDGSHAKVGFKAPA